MRRLSSIERTVSLGLATIESQCDQAWTLDAMAAHCELGRSRFTHYCRQQTGLSPIAWLTRCRVDRAKTMLRVEPSLSVSAVQCRCGFQTSQYFSMVFRRLTGTTPTAYRSSAGIDT
jgi:transcriptional regulator GlxA family with amidase domain